MVVRVPCWHRQRVLPCVPKFKVVSCCGRDSLVPRNTDFRFTGEKASGCPCQVSREYRVLCTHVALAVLPCVGGTWGESLEKNQIQPNGPTAVYLAHLPHPRKHSHLPSNPSSRAMILIFFCLRKTSFRTPHLIGPGKGQLLQKRRLS